MKKLFFSIGLALVALNTQAQIVSIPDPEFLKFLIGLKYVDLNHDGQIQTSEAGTLNRLEIKHSNIKDLSGIESFVNLTYLGCIDLSIQTLDLTKNTALIRLDCSYNKKLQVLKLDNNTVLDSLACRANNISSLDLSTCTALTKLECSGNQMTSLSLRNNTALTKLDCSGNQLTSLDVINCTGLIKLDCSSNKLTTIDVSNNIALANLDCHANQLTTLDVRANTSLRRLNCSENGLTSLDIDRNEILRDLSCKKNGINAIDVSIHPELQIQKDEFTVLTKSRIPGNEHVYLQVEAKAGFDRGELAMNLFIEKHLHHPRGLKKDLVQGWVEVEFIVDEEGKRGNFQVIEGIDHDFDRAAITVIEIMPRWNPGWANNHPVKSKTSLKIHFKEKETFLKWEEQNIKQKVRNAY